MNKWHPNIIIKAAKCCLWCTHFEEAEPGNPIGLCKLAQANAYKTDVCIRFKEHEIRKINVSREVSRT